MQMESKVILALYGRNEIGIIDENLEIKVFNSFLKD